MLGAGAFLAISAYATTWYVRDGGGTPAQCTGTTNAVYPGSGTNQACAINHPSWVIGSPGAIGLMVGGDTLYIVGDSDISSGAQAQYMIGYGMPNGGLPNCVTANAYLCVMSTIPAGISSTQLTTIIGIGTHQPQLWGTQAVNYILDLTAGNYDIENLEITGHSSCSYLIGSNNPGFNSYPGQCLGTDGNYPYGTYAKVGIEMEGTNITTKNLYVHRLALDDIYFPGNVSNWSSTNDKFISGANFLDDGGSMTFGGNNTMNNDVWAFGGCAEKYPAPDPGNVKDLNNYLNCCDQGGGCLGGGFMMQNDGSAACGNWTISDSQFLFNLKTNIDFLHCNGTGTFNIYRSRSEGSSGEALKLNVATVNIEESQLIGNAPVWTTAPFKAILAPLSTSNSSWAPIICRGNAVTVFAGNPGEQVNFLNDDITGNCTALVEISDMGQPASFACTKMSVNATNTKFISGYGYDINEQTNVYYVGGDDGNGSGACGTGAIPFNENYDNIYNENDPAHCTGANSLCGTDPKVTGEVSVTLATLLGPTSYYSATSLGDLLYLQPSSPLKGKAATNGTYINGSSNDYNNYPANSSPDIGAVQYGTCVLSGGYCSLTSQCCNGGTCTLGGQCTAPQPVVSITSPKNGSSYSNGSNVTITATASEANGTISNISLYEGLNVFLGLSNTSPFNYIATNLVEGSYTYTAQATDTSGISVTSTPITITVVAASLPSSLPVVSITSPVSGSSITAGSNLIISATASETNGTISNVSLYNGAGVLLGSSRTSSYNYFVMAPPVGTYIYTAQATDAKGISVTSSPTTVTVSAPSSPVVTITSPSNGSSFTAGSYITILAAASEANGTISKVAFYNGSTLLGTATSSPYSYTWNNVTAGNYRLTAVAYDNNNNKTTSTAVTVAVSGLPVVSLASNNATFTVPASVILTATASETNGTISKVGFYNGSTLLGTSTSSPYSLTWNKVAAGKYNLTAVATDANGVFVTSSPITLTVTTVVEIIANTNINKVIITGAWPTSTTISGYYGTNYIDDDNSLKGTKSVKYTPSLSGGAGSYQVYLRYSSYSNRASNVPVDIIHSGITTTVIVNQKVNGGTWVSLGTYNFLGNSSGEGLTIRTTSTNGYVIANAVEFIQLT